MHQPPPASQHTHPASVAGDFCSAEVITSLRRMITVLIYQNQIARRIGVLSALRREGTTHTTLALGTLLASDLGVRVCAVELNWHTPALLKQARPRQAATSVARGPGWWPLRRPAASPEPAAAPAPPPPPGLAEVLAGTASIDEAIVHTAMPGFAILPAGELGERERAPMARSHALRQTLDAVSTRFDYVLLDIPALLYTSDAIALASLSDALCLVVRQGVTPANSVRLALDEIKHLPMLGVVLNQVRVYTPRLIRQFIPQE